VRTQKLQTEILKNPRSPETVKLVIHPTCNTATRHLYPTRNKVHPNKSKVTKKKRKDRNRRNNCGAAPFID
jgi:hypothetical protein